MRHPSWFVRWFEPTDRELGMLGEEVAARHLVREGFEILGRRIRTSAGEIDVLARERGELVCVEVKTARVAPIPRARGSMPLQGTRWRPGARYSAERIARHVHAGRADLIEVFLDLARRRFRIEHHRRLERPLR